MKSSVILIFMENHTPSTEARKNLDFWLGRESMVNISYVPVSDSYSLHAAKKEYKFGDLPCLMEIEGKKSYKYYGEGIDSEIKRLKDKYAEVKK